MSATASATADGSPAPVESRPSAWQPATALIVDADPVSRRFVELALTQHDEFHIEAAESAASASEILARQPIELIISDSDLPDMNGLRFYRQLSQESRLRSIPMMFLSADQRPEPKVAALRAGVAEYLIKPCHPAELAARALSLVERERRLREQARRRNYMLAGDLAAIGFPDLVHIIEMEHRSGVVSMVLSGAVGQCFFDRGRIVHAVYGNLVGPQAFYRFVGETSGRFEFAPGESGLSPQAHTITGSSTALLLEGARLLDTRNAAAAPAAQVVRRIATPTHQSVELAPSPPADPRLAVQLETGIADPFALGELCLWTAAELSRWTRREIGTQRLHVHLIAGAAPGVSAILGVSSPATERVVLSSLQPTRKATGVTFFLRRERTVDVVLLDAVEPETFGASLKRTPAFVILAPQGGDLMSMGIRARVSLEGILRRSRPPILLAVGDRSMRTDSGLTSLAAHVGRVHFVEGVLSESGLDLRTLLVEGIREWGRTATQKGNA